MDSATILVLVLSAGVLALLVSVWQYRRVVRYLWSGPYTTIAGVKEDGMQTPVIAVGALLMLIGLFAFFAVLLRLA